MMTRQQLVPLKVHPPEELSTLDGEEQPVLTYQEQKLVYKGFAAGSDSLQKGGGSQYLCLPWEPRYSNFRPGVGGHSPLVGVKYMPLGWPLPSYDIVQNHNVPCAVCCTNRSKLFMLPATDECPKTWTREYSGYLMTEHRHHHRKSFECVDKKPKSLQIPGAALNGTFFSLIEATCNGIPCPPYDPKKELTCAVCTK